MKLDTYSASLIWASVIVFAVHNAEETSSVEGWMAENFRSTIAARYRKKPFLVACTLLSAAYAAVALFAVRFTGPTALQVFGVAFAAIIANGFVHLFVWLFLGKVSPGFWSAAILVLPLGGLLTWHAIAIRALTPHRTLATFVVGAVLQVPLAGGAIFVTNYLLSRVERFMRTVKATP